MATELQILAWCDVCLDAGENVPGETLTVAAGVVPPFDIELCPRHAKPLAEAVAVLAPLGRGVGKGVPTTPGKATRRDPPAPGDGTCPDCGKAYTTAGALRAHLRDIHDKSLADVGLSAGDFKCPECGSAFNRKQGLGVHMTRRHPGIAGAKESA